jgi:hypothetical protein
MQGWSGLEKRPGVMIDMTRERGSVGTWVMTVDTTFPAYGTGYLAVGSPDGMRMRAEQRDYWSS